MGDDNIKIKRAPNFREDEKTHLFSIIGEKFHHILEDKKTDRASVQKRQEAWKKIEGEFNSSNPSVHYRNADCLKKLYENSKKELRKVTAEHKQNIIKTGGGTPPDISLDPTQKLLCGIINSKTVNGLDARADSDGHPKHIIKKRKLGSQVDLDVDEYTFEDDSIIIENAEYNLNEDGSNLAEILHFESNEDDECQPDARHTKNHNDNIVEKNENKQWAKYTPENLKKPINPALEVNNPRSSSCQTPRQPLSSQRRRPVKTIQTLTSSKISEKYNLLLDKRLVLVEKQISQVNMDINFKRQENSLKIQILELELESRKPQI